MSAKICDYGNCDKTEARVIVTLRSHFTRGSFCSIEHAVKWLVGKAIYPASLHDFAEKYEPFSAGKVKP